MKELIKLIEEDEELFSLIVFIGGFGLIGAIGLILWLVSLIQLKKKGDNMFDKKELGYLEEMINEEIKDYLNSGYPLEDDYVVTLRGMLEKLGLKEIYKFEKWRDD